MGQLGVIILGASIYDSPFVLNGSQFAESARAFKKALTDRAFVGDRSIEVLDLFDSDDSPGSIAGTMLEFISRGGFEDLVIFHCGHSSRLDGDLFLHLRGTRRGALRSTTLRVRDLLHDLERPSMSGQVFLIIDATVTGGAFAEFMDPRTELRIEDLSSIRTRAAVLVANESSAAPVDDLTPFTAALLRTLKTGIPRASDEKGLSWHDVLDHIRADHKRAVPAAMTIIGDRKEIAELPFFVNRAFAPTSMPSADTSLQELATVPISDLLSLRGMTSAIPVGTDSDWTKMSLSPVSEMRSRVAYRRSHDSASYDWASPATLDGGQIPSPKKFAAIVAVSAVLAAAAWIFRRELALIGTALFDLFRSSVPVGAAARRLEDTSDLVDVSVFGPATLEPGSEGLVQVFLHALDERAVALSLARDADPDAQRRGIKTLAADIQYGQSVQILIDGRGLKIQPESQTLIWRGRADACQFVATMPEVTIGTTFHPQVLVLVNSVPVGSLIFSLRAGARAHESRDFRGEKARRYKRAFLSYASKNRAEVLRRAQMLKVGQITFFQDLLSLDPGVRWERQLYSEIDRCDLFLLFWSSAARESEWVLKEVEYAIARQKDSDDELPDIMPVILEGPPPPPPPDCLKHMHFNDSLLYVLAAVEAEASDSRREDRPH